MSADGLEVIGEMKRRDGDNIARGVFALLDYLGPVHIPAPYAPQNPAFTKAVEAWRKGAHLPDEHVGEFAAWLDRAQSRSKAISENERRLNTTIWAQERLRGQSDYFERFAQFHLEAWGIEQWSDNATERAEQVKACARMGVPPNSRRDGKHG
jgi:hypothetical protein